jgi:hypothetical protein
MRTSTGIIAGLTLTTMAGLTACGSGAATAGGSGTHAPASQSQTAQASAPASAGTITTRLATAGLGVTKVIVYTEATDPNHHMGRQGGYTSKTAWVDSSIYQQALKGSGPMTGDNLGSVAYGGGIETFPDAASAQARYDLLKGFTAPFGDGYDYLYGNSVLRLSQYLVPAQAQRYEAAFRVATR